MKDNDEAAATESKVVTGLNENSGDENGLWYFFTLFKSIKTEIYGSLSLNFMCSITINHPSYFLFRTNSRG